MAQTRNALVIAGIALIGLGVVTIPNYSLQPVAEESRGIGREGGEGFPKLASGLRRLGGGGIPGDGHTPFFSDDEGGGVGDWIVDGSPKDDSHFGDGTGRHHWHKPLHPVNSWDVLGVGLAMIGLMIAAAGGIGGGGILVPLYILVLQFDPKHAIPLSNITIFGGAITNTLLNLSKRHPDADRPLVDWDLILVMEPLTIGGALVGSFINKVLPDYILAVMLIVLLAATANRTLRKGFKAYNKETKMLQEEAMNTGSELTTVHENLQEEDLADEGQALLAESQKNVVGDPEFDDKAFELKQILDEERFTPLFKVGTLTGVFIIVLAVNLLKGGGAFPSPLGIKCGSYAFWGSTVFIFIWVLLVSWWVRDYLVKRWQTKGRLGYRYYEGDVEWNASNTIRYPAVCFFAGFFAGLFGVGGGIVKGPLMLEMGVHPMVASATSAVMILYTSFTASTSFIVFGLLQEDYALALFFVGIGATAVGQIVVNHLVKKYKRTSFIILSIGSVVALSAVMMGSHSLYNFLVPSEDAEEDGGFCSAGE